MSSEHNKDAKEVALAGVVIAVSISSRKSVRKRNVPRCNILADHGFEGDAHAGDWHRQVSLLAEESIDKMRAVGLVVGPGDFAENITTRGLLVADLPVGTKLQVGKSVLMRVTQVGKECHTRCAIYRRVGDCVMPREGIFAEVLKGGNISAGDKIRVIKEGT